MNSPDPSIISRNLVDVAMGRKAADIVIRNGRWVCVQSGEIIPGHEIAIFDQRIAFVGPDAAHTIGPNTEVIDASDRYMLPGLLDGHMHIESGMLTITEFIRAIIPHGTTGIFIDPHEIANVLGINGVKLMVDEATAQPIHVWVQVPSCVPSAPGFETPGASLGPDEIAQALQWDGIIGLGEMMNFPGVFNSDENVHLEMAATRQAGKVIGGHFPSPVLGLPFHGYVAGGPEDDHEGTTMTDAAARVRQGMKAMLRYGSAWHDVAEGVRAIHEAGLDSRNFILCTDDSHCETLVYEGHVNRAVNQAIAHGIPPIKAIQMATINTAEHFSLSRDIGMIAPGRYADILLVPNLYDIRPDLVIAKGRLIAENQKVTINIPAYPYPEWALNTIHLPDLPQVDDFRVKVDPFIPMNANSNKVLVNVIGIIENQAPTRHLQFEMSVENGEIKADIARDIAKVALVERHHGTGRIQRGFVNGFMLDKTCAIGSTVAHDSHHMLIIGTDEKDMCIVADQLRKMGGGQVVVSQGEVLAKLPLPIAGLMSNQHADIVAQQARQLLDSFRDCGCTINNPNMQLSLLALVVIPEIRISDLGLVDVNKFRFIPLIESEM